MESWDVFQSGAAVESPANARQGIENASHLVYNWLILVLVLFFIRVLVTASICHYVFNRTVPCLLESVIGKAYDRGSFRPLPMSTVILMVIGFLVLFPSK